MEVLKDKETGSAQIHLSNEEVKKLIGELQNVDTEILKVLKDKIWND